APESANGSLTAGFIQPPPTTHMPPSPLPMELPNGTLFLALHACKAPCGPFASREPGEPKAPTSCRPVSRDFSQGGASGERRSGSESRPVEPAVNGDVVAIDVPRLLRTEVDDRRRDLGRLAESACGHSGSLDHPFPSGIVISQPFVLSEVPIGGPSPDPPGGDRIDGDSEAGVLVGNTLEKPN